MRLFHSLFFLVLSFNTIAQTDSIDRIDHLREKNSSVRMKYQHEVDKLQAAINKYDRNKAIVVGVGAAATGTFLLDAIVGFGTYGILNLSGLYLRSLSVYTLPTGGVLGGAYNYFFSDNSKGSEPRPIESLSESKSLEELTDARNLIIRSKEIELKEILAEISAKYSVNVTSIDGQKIVDKLEEMIAVTNKFEAELKRF
jgi:hypothetical protein